MARCPGFLPRLISTWALCDRGQIKEKGYIASIMSLYTVECTSRTRRRTRHHHRYHHCTRPFPICSPWQYSRRKDAPSDEEVLADV